MYGFHHGHFVRLDDLAAAAGHDAAAGGGDHVDLADAGPEQGHASEGHDQPLQVAWGRVHRAFLQGEGCREEVGFVRQARCAVELAALAPGVFPRLVVTLQEFVLGGEARLHLLNPPLSLAAVGTGGRSARSAA